MQGQGSPLTPRATMLAIVFSNSVMPVVLLLLSITMPAGGSPQTIPDTAAYGVALAALAASIGFAMMKLSPFEAVGGTDLVPPQRYQTLVLIALVIAEFGAIVGFVAYLGNETKFWPIAAATIAVNALAILPRVLAYWKAYDERDGSA